MFAFGGVVALESVLGLIAFDEFEQGPADAWLIWGILSLASMLGSLTFNWLKKCLGSIGPAACGLYLISTVGGAMVVNWADPSKGVHYYLFLIGLLLKSSGTVGTVIVYMTTIVDQVPPSLVATATAMIGAGTVLGRALAPVGTTWIFERVVEMQPAGTLYADNVALLVQYTYVLISFSIGLCNYKFIFIDSFLTKPDSHLV